MRKFRNLAKTSRNSNNAIATTINEGIVIEKDIKNVITITKPKYFKFWFSFQELFSDFNGFLFLIWSTHHSPGLYEHFIKLLNFRKLMGPGFQTTKYNLRPS